MTGFVRQICALSVFCGIALTLMPEGSVKKATGLCCALLLMITALTAFRAFDFSTYALELAHYREMGRALAAETEERRERIDRLVIERETAAYISRLAADTGMREPIVEVEARWDTAGIWVPEKIRLTGVFTDEQRAILQERISADLGIDNTHQEWILNEV